MSTKNIKGSSMSFAEILDEELPAPPPSFADIMKSFSKDGNGDAQTLLAILSAKQAEEDRLAKTLEIRIHLLQMHAQRLGMVPNSSTAQHQGYLTPPYIPHKLYGPLSPPYTEASRRSSSSSHGLSPREEPRMISGVPSARQAAAMRRSSSTSSSGSGSMIENRSLPLRETLKLAPLGSIDPALKQGDIQLTPISPKSFPTYPPTSAYIRSTFTPLSTKRKLSSSAISDSENDEEDKDVSAHSSKRTRSDTLTQVESATALVGARRRDSNVSGRSRSSSGGRMTNGLEMLLNAAEMEKK